MPHTQSSRRIRVGYLVGLALSIPAWAQDNGALPRGKSPGPGIDYKVESQVDLDPSCFSYHYNPEDGQFLFTPDGLKLLWVAKDQRKKDASQSSYLVELDLISMKFKKIFGLKAEDQVLIVGHGKPLHGISAFEFARSTHGCGQGYSAGIGIMWGEENRVIQSFPDSYYKLLPSDRGLLIADRKEHTLRGIDLKSGQRMSTEALPKSGIPLYLDDKKNELFIFENDGAGILKKLHWPSLRALAKLKLGEGMKLVQQRERFAVARLVGNNVLDIKRIDGWAGVGFESYQLELKAPFEAKKSRVLLDFNSGIAAVLGESRVVRRDWRDLLVYDARKKRQLARVKAPEDSYIAAAALDPKGRFFVFLTRKLADESLAAVSLYRIESRKWEPLHLNFVKN